jgi:hypothetical protein
MRILLAFLAMQCKRIDIEATKPNASTATLEEEKVGYD